MKKKMKDFAAPLLFHSGFPYLKKIYRRAWGKGKIFILMYHRVDKQSYPFYETAVHPHAFERQMQFLKKNFSVIDLADLKRLNVKEKSATDHVVITFDDGYRDNYLHAFPILKKYGLKATIFLATDYIGTGKLLWYDDLAWVLYHGKAFSAGHLGKQSPLHLKLAEKIGIFLNAEKKEKRGALQSIIAELKDVNSAHRERIIDEIASSCNVSRYSRDADPVMLSWDEVVQMSESGISFGCHTQSHLLLSNTEIDEARREIRVSREKIEGQIEKKVTTFAYPYGKKADYSEQVISILEEEGFDFACTTNRGEESFPLSLPYELKRRGVGTRPYLFL